MSAASVNERRDKQIQDAFDNRNWKQALQLCDKRLKKGEKSDHLLAWKAYILLACPDASRKKQGASETRALCEKNPPVMDLSALSMLEKCLRAMEAEDRLIAKLWMTAARARPQDAELQESWMMATFDAGDWKQAQSAAMTLQKNFPKKRHFYFWAILAGYLASTSSKASETDRRLFGTLAYKMISKAASEVPADPNELLSPPRAIQTIEELLLLVVIYRQHGHVKEALEALNSPNLGTSSRIGKGNWVLVREKLDLLEEAEMWQEEWDYCRTLLDGAHSQNQTATNGADAEILTSQGDDWRLWTGLLTASQNLDTLTNMQATVDIIHMYVDQEHSSRNSKLAFLKFLAQNIGKEPAKPAHLLSACKKYFEDNCTRSICFDDLRPYVEYIAHPEQESLIIHCISHAKRLSVTAGASEDLGVSWVTAEINSLKLEYMLKVSKIRSTNLLEHFTSNCIRLYQTSLSLGKGRVYSDNKPGDDACILAVMGLVLLSESGHKHYLLQIPPLLEFLLERSKHNYHALLVLIRVYMMLGAGSLAMKTYKRLAIKHMQHETLSHVLFTRLATLHPLPVFLKNTLGLENKDRDPIEGLEVALESYRMSARQSAVGKRLFLEKGRYNMLLGTLQVEDSMKRSITKAMWVFERRRMKRLVNYDGEEEYFDVLVPFPEDMEDHRGYDAFPDCEPSGNLKFEEYLRVGPKPQKRWLGAQIFIDKLVMRLRRQVVPIDESVEEKLYRSDMLPPVEEMTQHELDAFSVLCRLNSCCSSLLGDGLPQRTPLKQAVEDVNQCLDVLLQKFKEERNRFNGQLPRYSQSVNIPTGIYLNGVFSLLEMCKCISTFLEIVDANTKRAENSLPKEQVARLRDSVEKFYRFIRTDVTDIKDGLSTANDELHQVMRGSGEGKDGDVWKAMDGLMDKSWIEKTGVELIESWLDAVDGVLKIRLGLR